MDRADLGHAQPSNTFLKRGSTSLIVLIAILFLASSASAQNDPPPGQCSGGLIRITNVAVIPDANDPLSGIVRVSTFYDHATNFVGRSLSFELKGGSAWNRNIPNVPPGAQTIDFQYELSCNLPVAEDRAATFTLRATTHSSDHSACNYEDVHRVVHAVDPTPRVTSLERTGILASGSSVIKVGWHSSLQKELVVRLFVDGVPWAFQTKNERSGTAIFETNLGCLSEGEHTISADVNACYDVNNEPRSPNYGSPDVTVPLNVPGAAIAIALRRLRSGNIEATIDYTVPPNTGTWNLNVNSLARFREDGVFEPSLPVLNKPVSQSGREVKIITPPSGARQLLLNGVLSSCHGRHEDSSAIECFVCNEAPSGTRDPVAFVDGDMRYDDADLLPPQLDAIALSRTYDGHHQINGLFGRGWMSMFDRRLWVTTRTAGELVYFTTATNDAIIFAKTGGGYVQHWPKGRASGAGVLTKDQASGFYVHREPGSLVASLFRITDGRFAGLRQLGTGRQMTIDYGTSGVPTSVTDSWTGLKWLITADGTNRRIGTISVEQQPRLVWRYVYDGNGNLLNVVAPGEATWRTYSYNANNRMISASDGAGNMIESHDYDSAGYATSSTGPEDEISTIEYDLPVAGRTDARITRVTTRSGAITEYVLALAGSSWRTVQVKGGCASCSRDSAFVYDTEGHVIRHQHADGYVTVKTYANGRLVSVQAPMRRVGCDPEIDTNRCRVDDLTLGSSALETTPATLTTTYAYGDARWPDRITSTTSPSIGPNGGSREQSVLYHATNGAVVSTLSRGWTTGEATRIERETTTTFYGDPRPPHAGDEDPDTNSLAPAFDPGGTFQSAWLTLPQPFLLRRSVDGPRKDVQDVTLFVYYPVDATVSSELRGRLAAVKNAAGQVTRYERYDNFANVTRIVDPNGVATEMTYDSLGRVSSSTTKGIAGCDTSKDPLCATDLTTTLTYWSATGPLKSETRPGGGVTAYTYDVRGRVLTVSRGPSPTDLRERIEYEYDSATGEKKLERLLALNEAEAEKKLEQYSYDSLGQLALVTYKVNDTTNATIAYGYDAEGRLASVRDENHTLPNTRYSYDPAGRLAGVMQTLAGAPNGSIATSYEYDIHGNLTSVTDPNGNETLYTYDDFGAMNSQVSPVTGTSTYAYDEAGSLVSSTDANGAVTQRSYDSLNRVIAAVSQRDGKTETVTWDYDDPAAGRFAIGRIATMIDPAGSTSYHYERRGFLREESRTFSMQLPTPPPGDGNGRSMSLRTSSDDRNPLPSHVAVTKFVYDRDGNRSTVQYPSGDLTVNYTFDHAGRATSASGIVTSASYLPFGPVTELRLANGTTQKMQYDKRYRMTKNELSIDGIQGNPGLIAGYGYDHDAAGNITKITDSKEPDYARHFEYDKLNRLVKATTRSDTPGNPSPLWGRGEYAWDAMGNILKASLAEIEPGGGAELLATNPKKFRPRDTPKKPGIESIAQPLGRVTTFSYVGTTPVLATVTLNDLSRTITHDAAGNEIKYVVTRSYSPRNLLATVTDEFELESDVHTLAYGYDGRGVRVARAESPSEGPGTTAHRYYVYSPELQLLSATRDDRTNVWGGKPPSPLANNVDYEIVWFDDRPIAQIEPNGARLYTFADHLETPLLQIDGSQMITTVENATAAIRWRVEYEPFGAVYEVRAGVRSDQPLRFPGQEVAMTWEGPEENYNIFRSYKSPWGRYATADPLGSLRASGKVEHPYTYAQGRPLHVTDRYGLDSVTGDTGIQNCIFCIFDRAGRGFFNSEEAFWLICDPAGGYKCVLWPATRRQGTSQRSTTSWRGPLPANVCGLVHTHPRRKNPQPSSNCSDCDVEVATRLQMPIYSAHPDGVWKYDPATKGPISKEEDGKTYWGPIEKRCKGQICRNLPK